MHRLRARIVSPDGNENKRYSLMFSPHARRSEHVPPPSPAPQSDRRQSDSGPRSEAEDPGLPNISERDDSNKGSTATGSPSDAATSANNAAVKRNRFNLLRFRHASDPQLSASYAQGETDVPPVPQVPPPPTIITTAPTTSNLEKSARKGKLKLPLSRKASKEDIDASGSGPAKTPVSQALGNHSRPSHEEPGRLSTSTYQSATTNNPSEQDTRISESSRSEQGSVEKGDAPHPNKRLHMPRLMKSRGNLFPVSVKLPPPETGGSHSGRHSPISNGVYSGRTSRTSIDPNTPDDDQVSPLPSPTESAVKLSSSPKATHAPPHLFRKNSTTSARSGQSATSTKGPTKGRGRSSTLNSLIDASRNADDPKSSSSNLPSGRNSTSTNGRKSFGDLFNLNNRLRQNSELSTPRDGHTSPRPPGTPGSESKTGSLSVSRTITTYPEREEDDTPATYLSKLQDTVYKGAIGTILSKSDDEFYKVALRKFMRTFAFFGEPIDMAIRKLLMEAELPKETQQIDRFLQSFADRYYECNPGIFATTDQTYFIAFSILILHTDVFNKNNKRKMQKHDYVKNSRIDGVSEDILECFYENICYTPFIHVEDELNPSARQAPRRRALFKATSTDHLARASGQPVDPYAVIMDNKLDTLRPGLKEVMNIDDPYSFPDTDSFKDIESLHQAFSKSAVLQIVSARSRPDAFMTSTNMQDSANSQPGLVDIKVVKVGLLWRKDPRKKRARSPWQEWGALLTSSQLYFFRDLYWTKSLMSQYENQHRRGSQMPVVFTPPITDFKPDAIMSTSDAVGLIDSSYKRHKHAFLLVRHNGLEEVFLANSDADMNDWLAKINYAATFRSTGVSLKATVGARYEGQKHQHPPRTEHLPQIEHLPKIDSEFSGLSSQPQTEAETQRPSSADNDAKEYVDPHLAEEMSAARQQLMSRRIIEADEKLLDYQRQLDDLLRNARHLQLLTPVNTRARENVILAAGRMAAKLRWVRLDLWRTKCYSHFLSLDLGLDSKALRDAQKRISLTISKPSSPGPSNTSLARLSSVHSSFSVATSGNEAEAPVAPTSPVSSEGQTATSEFLSPLSADRLQLNVSPSAVSSDEKQQAVSPISELPNNVFSDSSTEALHREPSVLSSGSKSDTNAGNASNAEDIEERVLRENGLLSVDGPADSPKLSSKSMNEVETPNRQTDEKAEFNAGDLRNPHHRRSLQRTLRDAAHHMPTHQRSKKGKDPNSTIPLADNNNSGSGEGEGLSRKDANFTLHGKKASVITFGSEWQNISPEERLKLRKPAASEESRASEPNLSNDATRGSISSASIHSGRPQSMRSTSTATARSSRLLDSVSVGSGIPEVPSLDAPAEQSDAPPDQGKDDDKGNDCPESLTPTAATTSTTAAAHASSDSLTGRETGEIVELLPAQEKPQLNPHEQAVGA